MASQEAAEPPSGEGIPAAMLSSSNKATLYVGGLTEGVNAALVRAAFVPFGPVRDCDVPMDYKEGKNRGFGFVSFEDEDDASEATYNMDGAELLGRVLTVNIAQPNQHRGGSNKAVWSTDEWLVEQAGGEGAAERKENEERAGAEVEALREK
mmetsp:Transcript_49212/g.96243  ORF Transcript_49212/g.96243 Transcript_49212/m.96243 type:complete len:152 (+) Transcript_49212:89-544(+)|eukprot:CAMPEP_0194324342 /NCGR_PEP_ID=MMETSP0171-20130528/27494_1 /TAXON_ID=218684 /ORGANISM="Corethron pennatum, Strain L29A3" /LENGTH=151 /DNA_ID=CAMNT_0039083215 /DNA_START=163 /DNA_END=618 /DNA_ORIENTATION=+